MRQSVESRWQLDKMDTLQLKILLVSLFLVTSLACGLIPIKVCQHSEIVLTSNSGLQVPGRQEKTVAAAPQLGRHNMAFPVYLGVDLLRWWCISRGHLSGASA